MAVEELHPEAVYRNSTLMGSGLWSDNSDSTSVAATVARNSSGTTTTAQYAIGVLPAYTGSDNVSAIALRFRASATASPSTTTISVATMLRRYSLGPVWLEFAEQNAGITADGAIRDYSYAATVADLTIWGYDIPAIISGLTSPGSQAFGLYFSPFGMAASQSFTVTVYEAWLELTASGRKYPLRRHPRSDGYGLGPTRHYPPPESRRKAGGYK